MARGAARIHRSRRARATVRSARRLRLVFERRDLSRTQTLDRRAVAARDGASTRPSARPRAGSTGCVSCSSFRAAPSPTGGSRPARPGALVRSACSSTPISSPKRMLCRTAPTSTPTASRATNAGCSPSAAAACASPPSRSARIPREAGVLAISQLKARHNMPAAIEVWQAAHAWLASQKELRRPPRSATRRPIDAAATWEGLMLAYRAEKARRAVDPRRRQPGDVRAPRRGYGGPCAPCRHHVLAVHLSGAQSAGEIPAYAHGKSDAVMLMAR